MEKNKVEKYKTVYLMYKVQEGNYEEKDYQNVCNELTQRLPVFAIYSCPKSTDHEDFLREEQFTRVKDELRKEVQKWSDIELKYACQKIKDSLILETVKEEYKKRMKNWKTWELESLVNGSDNEIISALAHEVLEEAYVDSVDKEEINSGELNQFVLDVFGCEDAEGVEEEPRIYNFSSQEIDQYYKNHKKIEEEE